MAMPAPVPSGLLLDTAVTAATHLVLSVLAGWLAVAVLAAAARRAAGGRPRLAALLDRSLAVLVPGLAGRLLRAAVGIGAVGAGLAAPLVGGPTAVAAVLEGHPRTGAGPVAPATAVVHPSGVPSAPPAPVATTTRTPHTLRAASGPRPDPLSLWPLSAPAHRGTDSGLAAGTRDVVVLRGDSLWAIAARHLPTGSSAARIDAAWRRVYALNRAVVGADPDTLQPGQILHVPL